MSDIQPGPCNICGTVNYPLSLGGPGICPQCDCGYQTPQRQAKTIAALRAENERLRAAYDAGAIIALDQAHKILALDAENERLRGLIVRLGEWGKKALRKETAAALRSELAKECKWFADLERAALDLDADDKDINFDCLTEKCEELATLRADPDCIYRLAREVRGYE